MHTTDTLNEYRMTVEITKKFDSKITVLASSPEEAQRIAEIEAIRQYTAIDRVPAKIEATAHVDKTNPYVLKDRFLEQSRIAQTIIP